MFKTGETYKKPYKALTGQAKWDDIADLIQRWVRRHPEEMRDHLLYVRDMQMGLYDQEHGLTGGKGSKDNETNMRVSLSIPQELIEYIHFFYPTFLDTKEDVQEVKKRFKGFLIPTKT